MKKIWLLIFCMLILASLDAIGIDQLLRISAASEASDRTDDSDSSGQTGVDDFQINNGVPPEQVSSVIREELMLFPIPISSIHPKYQFSFEDSWMSTRTFGGDRGHEGTDIMLDPDERGIFPVLSMTDGRIEKKGWLPQGGYRLGIRSTGGIYYYYAHLYDYAEGIEAGTEIAAGQLLGFAGDSGYSNIEGTVGNFPVHLHIGIYYNDNDETGAETAINPYPFLLLLPTVTIEF